ncbi:MAG: ABC transporter ATP-binding protein [Treponema sp.]|jgi:oligopeptide/dipeptide ABC transporter ATP-binding protein|nr:ABC transporter ATP-binding protein [Treponema sp.]
MPAGKEDPLLWECGSPPAILDVDMLRQYFYRNRDTPLKAVDGISFSVRPGEILGLVGESGCGKSTLARSILRIYEPTGGQVLFEGNDITHLSRREMRPYRKKMQMIFQDPLSSLDPRMTVRDILMEPLAGNGIGGSSGERLLRVEAILEQVGLSRDALGRYPREFSGGQCQRIGVARALVTKPGLVVCDEPISALDLSIRSQIVNLLLDFQRELGCAYIFITHDLSVVRFVSDRVAVMYLGRIVELCPGAEISGALHPYTRTLLEALPAQNPRLARQKDYPPVIGELPDPASPPKGCSFHPRCRFSMPVCEKTPPAAKNLGGRTVCCHLY